jgi:hypothetical protein
MVVPVLNFHQPPVRDPLEAAYGRDEKEDCRYCRHSHPREWEMA